MPGDNNHPNWHVRCVSVPGPDTDLSLHVAFDNARFLFGCGDGTQRAFVQKRLSLKGLNAVFLPNSESRTRGGLPGECDEGDAEFLRTVVAVVVVVMSMSILC
jgi:ribonuclease Z